MATCIYANNQAFKNAFDEIEKMNILLIYLISSFLFFKYNAKSIDINACKPF